MAGRSPNSRRSVSRACLKSQRLIILPNTEAKRSSHLKGMCMATNSHSIRIDAPEHEILEALTTKQGLQGWYTPTVEDASGRGSEVILHFTGKDGPFRWKIRDAGPARGDVGLS